MGHPIIVCYTGGTCGDIISQILDPAELTTDRQRLKKPHLFTNSQEKDLFLSTTQYLSIPSHDFEYHRDSGHNVLAIVCRYMPDAIWAATRFKSLHKPHVWKEMTKFCGANSIESYAQMILDFGNMIANYATDIVYLDDIVHGKAVSCLIGLGYTTPGANKYKEWLIDNENSNYSN